MDRCSGTTTLFQYLAPSTTTTLREEAEEKAREALRIILGLSQQVQLCFDCKIRTTSLPNLLTKMNINDKVRLTSCQLGKIGLSLLNPTSALRNAI